MLGLVLRLLFIYKVALVASDDPARATLGDDAEYRGLARSLAETGAYPSVYRPPGFPFVASLLLRAGAESDLALYIFQSLLNLIMLVLLYRLVQSCFGAPAALLSAFLLAIHPECILWSGLYMTEILFTTVFVGLFALLTRLRQGDTKRVTVIATAIITAAANLIRPFNLAFVPVFGYAYTRSLWRYAAVCGLSFALILPYTARNWSYSGHFVLISQSFGEVFWSGNNPHSRGYGTRDNVVEDSPVNINRYSALRAQRDFRVVFDRIALHEALVFIKHHPAQEAGLLLRKALLFLSVKRDWVLPVYLRRSIGTFGSEILPSLLNIVVFGFFLYAMTVWWRTERREEYLLFLYPVLYTWAMIVLTYFQERFRFPAVPFIASLAAVGMTRFWEAMRAQRNGELGWLCGAFFTLVVVNGLCYLLVWRQ